MEVHDISKILKHQLLSVYCTSLHGTAVKSSKSIVKSMQFLTLVIQLLGTMILEAKIEDCSDEQN